MRNLQPNLEFDSIIGRNMFRMIENREFCRKKIMEIPIKRQ